MKFPNAIAAVFLLTVSSVFASGGDDHRPVHGGIVAETKLMDFELVVKPDLLQLYLRDHGKPIDLSKATGKITLLAGKEKQEVVLQVAGNRLEAQGHFKVPPGTKVVAQVTVAGKSSNARFVLK